MQSISSTTFLRHSLWISRVGNQTYGLFIFFMGCVLYLVILNISNYYFFIIQGMSPISVSCFVLYILASLTTFGMMFDRHPGAIMFELIRCVIFVFVSRGYPADGPDKTIMLAIQLFYVTSAIWWCLGGFKIMKIRERKID